MATPAVDAKSALLSDELKEFALAQPTSAFPKAGNFFCAICSQLAFDSWKLLCCNKSICSPCHDKLEFPTTCPSCDHSPLEADLCTVNKALRNTMRAWLQKQKKKEEAKNASKLETPAPEAGAEAADVQAANEGADKPVESVETVIKTEDTGESQRPATGGEQTDTERAKSVVSQAKENHNSLHGETERQTSPGSQNPTKSVEPTSAVEGSNGPQNSIDGSAEGMYGSNAMQNGNSMNGMPGQFGFGGFNANQGNFNGMGWNGMNTMNNMPGIMSNANWNNMNPMDFNNMNMSNMSNGMYNGFGGNMGMTGMNDISAMSMMNYGGGYGNGWQGGMNGAEFGNFNGYNNMGGYNQSGAQYPQMMSQFPKNNIPNQNRFNANGAAFSQQRDTRKGSQGNFGNQNIGPGSEQRAHSRPGSRGGPLHNVRRSRNTPPSPLAVVSNPPETDVSPPKQRDGQSPSGNAEASTEIKSENEHIEASGESTHEGKTNVEGQPESSISPSAGADNTAKDAAALTGLSGNDVDKANEGSGLNQIQTIESIETDSMPYDQAMVNGSMHVGGPYPQEMMNGFAGQDPSMMGAYCSDMGYNQNNFVPQGGYNTAYGAATVLIGEPQGVGVKGAPTGPRAMREGRPNTGFSSRANNVRFSEQAPTPSVPPTQEPAPTSPLRRGRSSPERDDRLRVKDKSPSRSRSQSRSRQKVADIKENEERPRSAERDSSPKRETRSVTPIAEAAYDSHQAQRPSKSSHHDEPDYRGDDGVDDYDHKYREDRDDRGDRVRTASVESRHRSRRDKEKRSSRSHRDRSREHRHRHRSRSPNADRYEEDLEAEAAHGNTDQYSESGSRRKSRNDKDKYRERDRSRDKDREREKERDRRDRRDRDRDYEYEKDKDRSRDKDRDRKRSRRDREPDVEDDRYYEDDKHRSSRRSRKDREHKHDKDRDADREESLSKRHVSPPRNAPTGPSADNFSIRGFSKNKKDNVVKAKPMAPPPTAPRAFQPPKGPAAERDKDRRDSRDHRRKSSVSSIQTPTTPTTPSIIQDQNHYAAEREEHIKKRERRDGDRDRNHERPSSSLQNRITSARPSLSSKRSRDDFDHDDEAASRTEDKESKIPTGPAAHRDKRRKSGDNAIANLFTAGLRKHAGSKRRGGVKNEGDAERELERVERERDRRW